jgi:amino-acid N-acetyltransferase
MSYTIRSARTPDVPVIRKLIDSNVESGSLLSKATVTLYEDIQEFCVAELSPSDALAGCGALHVMWEDLAEIRTVAVREDCRGLGIGHGIVDTLLRRASALGVDRVFVLTFAVDFFGKHGFAEINGTPVAAEVYQELLRSYDEGVAEFLDLGWVKPNTLGNTRMLLRLLPEGKSSSALCGRRYKSGGSIVRRGRQRGTAYVVRSRGADSAAGSLRRLPHRPRDVPPAGDVPEAPGGEGRQAPFARTPVLKYQVTTGLSELTELLNWLNGLTL